MHLVPFLYVIIVHRRAWVGKGWRWFYYEDLGHFWNMHFKNDMGLTTLVFYLSQLHTHCLRSILPFRWMEETKILMFLDCFLLPF